jgi:hypothetical protein
MLRTRSVAALASLALGTAGMLFGGTTPASATPPEVESIIRGVVQDPAGHYLDDVLVEAKRGGTVEASADTYASIKPEGPQHGFFGLYVHPASTGTGYKLVLSKPGYLTLTLGSKVFVEPGEINNIGAVTLLPEPKPSKTSARLKGDRIGTTERGKVVVDVTSKATPTGLVTVKDGRHVVGSTKLRKADEGTVTVALPRLARGTYPLKVYYTGSDTVAASKSKLLKLTVEKPRKHRTPSEYRPNIR